ncbi:hypothetical protein, partial [uncultured Nostoc sp.]|uniref:hypothetical protein n=1 Tax=uncultured Nostoc sp. TaxID=340711 RepID=UPI0035C9D356
KLTSAFTFRCFAQSVAASVLRVVTSAKTFRCFAQSVAASVLKIARSIKWLEVFVKAMSTTGYAGANTGSKKYR